ncbi:hypothetical protein, partial [Streptomyces sp. MH192]|uniref:hypothetical protein n=1 Tax=Streptomyces sp. MH192 TaxID=1945514 RepID=UPI001F3D6E32
MTGGVHLTGYGLTRYGLTGYGLTGYGLTGYGLTGYGLTGYGLTGYGLTGYGLTGYGLTGYEWATGYGVADLAGGGLSRWDVPRDGLPRRRLCGGLPRRDAVNPGRPGSSLDTGCLSTLHLTTRDGERLPGSALPRHAGGLLHTLHTLHADGRGRGRCVGSGGSGRAGYRHCLPRSAGNRGPQPLCARHPRRTRRTRRAGLSRHLSGRGPGCARRPPAPRG